MASAEVLQQRKHTDVLRMSVDDAQDSRLSAIEGRLLAMEQAVIEIAALNKIIKIIAISLAASFGLDIHSLA